MVYEKTKFKINTSCINDSLIKCIRDNDIKIIDFKDILKELNKFDARYTSEYYMI